MLPLQLPRRSSTTDAALSLSVLRDLGQERSRLTELAMRSTMMPLDIRAVTEDMKAFEVRARERGLAEAEVASTYSHVSLGFSRRPDKRR